MLVGVAKGKLYRWYKDILSGFSEPDTQENLHHYDIRTKEIDHRTQQEQIIRVPILKPENLEAEMAIVEKYIGGEFYTILSNRINGKIALMAGTLKSEQLCGLLSHFHEKLFTVKHITRDLSGSYDWVCRQMFMNAAHTADKFHILTHLFDALQSVRIYHRQKILTMQREALEAFKKQEKEQKDLFKKQNVQYISKEFKKKEQRLENGETMRELLARSQYLLYKYPDQWSFTQLNRAELLFGHFPDIHQAYKLCISFRNWYQKDNIHKPIEDIRSELQRWYKSVEEYSIEELLNFKSLVERHEGIILNYFLFGKTNANAESLNAKIQRFIQSNKGARDRDFTFFRLKIFFS
jgi:transposase